MTVYVLESSMRPNALNYLSARIGFADRGEATRVFAEADFDALPLAIGDIVVGGITLAHRAFDRLGIKRPALSSVPEALRPFAGRQLWTAPMREVRRRVANGEVIFVKPRPSRYKLFAGTLASTVRDLVETASLPDDEAVVCAEPVSFASEHRCFVTRGSIVGVRHYKGDPLLFPDASVVRAALRAYAEAPDGYALDVGVTEDGRTLVVEVNDGYASGAYGLSPGLYAGVIGARWEELARGT